MNRDRLELDVDCQALYEWLRGRLFFDALVHCNNGNRCIGGMVYAISSDVDLPRVKRCTPVPCILAWQSFCHWKNNGSVMAFS